MKAIESWKEDAKVAVFASGGLTHFVIDEDLDQRVIESHANAPTRPALAAIPESYLLGNTCEIRNWMPLSVGMNALGKKMTLVDYVAVLPYRGRHGQRHGFRLLAVGLRGESMSAGAAAGDFVTRLKKLDCCAVSDALDKLHLKGAVTGLTAAVMVAADCGAHSDGEAGRWRSLRRENRGM